MGGERFNNVCTIMLLISGNLMEFDLKDYGESIDNVYVGNYGNFYIFIFISVINDGNISLVQGSMNLYPLGPINDHKCNTQYGIMAELTHMQ